MMEGDLLEVSLEETDQIWRILSNTGDVSKNVRKWPPLDKSMCLSDGKEMKKVPQQRGRKRKSEELDATKKKKVDEKTAIKRKGVVKETKPVSSPVQMKRGPRKVNQ